MNTKSNISSENEALALLPWYVNGTLEEGERVLVEELLKDSEEARQELVLLKSLHQSIQQEESIEAPTAFGWRRLQRDIKAEKASKVTFLPKLAAIAAVFLICIQFVFVYQLQDDNQRLSIQLLSGDAVQQGLGDSDANTYFKVRFRSDAKWSDIQQLLNTYDLSIVDGPSAMGLVTLVSESDSIEALIAEIKQQRLVEHIQIIKDE